MDPVSLIKEREGILGIKAARKKYYLPVEVETMTIAAAIMKSQTKESCDTPKAAEKLICPQRITFKSRLTIGKG